MLFSDISIDNKRFSKSSGTPGKFSIDIYIFFVVIFLFRKLRNICLFQQRKTVISIHIPTIFDNTSMSEDKEE